MISALACDGVIQVNPLSCDGSWVAVASSVFDVSMLSPVTLVEAVGAGFVFAAVPLAFIWSARILLKPLFSKNW